MAIDFQQKLGPLPVWGWGIVGAAVVFVGYQFISRGGSGTTASGSSSIDSSGYQTAGIKGGSASGVDPLPETNQGWLSRVSRLVAGANSASPSDVNAALYKYITGQSYTTKEKEYIDQAISMGGAPPEGTQGIGEEIKPKPTSKGLFRNIMSDSIYEQFSDGTKSGLSFAEWSARGTPAPTLVDADGDLIVGYDRVGTGVFAVDSTGQKIALTLKRWLQAGSPAYKQVG